MMVLAIKFAFIVVFEVIYSRFWILYVFTVFQHVVTLIVGIIAVCIPDEPASVKLQVMGNNHIVDQTKIKINNKTLSLNLGINCELVGECEIEKN